MVEERKPLDLSAFEGHTPGPWRKQTSAIGAPVIMGPFKGIGIHERQVAKVLFNEIDGSADPEVRPNARLILAAPDLLAEVERLRGLLKRARIQIATHIHGRKVHDEIAAALGEVPTNG